MNDFSFGTQIGKNHFAIVDDRRELRGEVFRMKDGRWAGDRYTVAGEVVRTTHYTPDSAAATVLFANDQAL